jgi:serine/threonine protein kinase/Tol biopolymer transport system component
VIGETIGSYRITAKLGEGGMGTVYRATDSRLGREVAIKFSAQQFSERFEREACAIAALNHPHVCQLYDVGPNYLVMELIEGTPLRGPLPLEKAIEYAGQILDALDAAHAKGITHRDLKPANILVTKQGIKLLDFGLAKQQSPVLTEADATVTQALTRDGQIAGTLQYMSPEQLQGKEINARSDLFSFGCVLYEMLTGKRAFEGQSTASVIAAILEREPAPLEVARPLDRVVRRSLAKDPEQRFQCARDLKAALAWALEQAPPMLTSQPQSKLLAGVAAVLAVIAAISLWAWWHATRQAQQALKPLTRLDVDLGSETLLASQRGTDVIISSDGTRLVYVSRDRLLTRRLDQPKATELAGTEGAYAPFFSPDGQWVAFFTPSKLKKVSVDGGSAIDLCNVATGYGGSWGEDGTIIAALSTYGPLSGVSAVGGAPSPVMEMARGDRALSDRWPQILPGGKAVLLTSSTAVLGARDYAANVEVLSLGDRRRKTLVRGGTNGRYLVASNGASYLIYVNQGTLFAVRFDMDRLELRGTPVPVMPDVSYSASFGYAQYSLANNGTLVYRSARGAGLFTLQWLDKAGKMLPVLPDPGAYGRPRFSPDGHRIALELYDSSGSNIWAYDVQRDVMTPLTFGGGSNQFPVWTPDGHHIVFTGPGGMFWTRADGAGKPQPLTESKNPQLPWSFTPDGKRMAFQEIRPESSSELWVVPVEEDGMGLRVGKPEALLKSQFNARYPTFSPDGRWLAYASDQSGRLEVYVSAYPDRGGKWQVSSNGGVVPEWSHNGRELFFRTEDNRIMVAGYTVKGDTFVTDKPHVWSEKQLAGVGLSRNYDVAPDGKRVVALMTAETQDAKAAQNHVIFLLNFADEVRRRVPVGK